MKCRICSGDTTKSYLLRSHRNDGLVQLFYCRACVAYFSAGGLINYDDSDLVDYYLPHEQAIRKRFQKDFEFIESIIAPGRFLDIGAGIGYSLEIAKQRGWTATGLEPNSVLARHASARGLNVINSYLSEEISGEYDFILLDNVLEHILQPAEFLTNVVRLLAPSGVILVAVPPMDWLRKMLGKSSYVREHVLAPQLNIFGEVDEHVNIFSRQAANRLLQMAGLRLLDVHFHHSKFYNNVLFRILNLNDGNYFATRA